MEPLIPIYEASDRTGLSAEQIEYAERSGLVSENREAEGYYSPEQVETLRSIARLVQMGLTMDDIASLDISEDLLSEIQEYLGFPHAGRPALELSTTFLKASIHVLRSHERVVNGQIEQLETLKHNLNRKVSTLRKVLTILEKRSQRAA